MSHLKQCLTYLRTSPETQTINRKSFLCSPTTSEGLNDDLLGAERCALVELLLSLRRGNSRRPLRFISLEVQG